MGGSDPTPLQRADVILQVNSAADHLSDIGAHTTLSACLGDRSAMTGSKSYESAQDEFQKALETRSAEETPNFAALIQRRALSSGSLPQ